MNAYTTYINEVNGHDDYAADIIDDEGLEWTDDDDNVIDYNTPNWWTY